MEFTSLSLMAAIPFVLIFYYILPRKLRYLWLLIISWLLCGLFMPKALICLVAVTIVSYLAGRLIEQTSNKKMWLTMGIGSVMLVMFSSKIFSQFISAVGISFYSLQAISYLTDIYRKKLGAERNFMRYALYLAFFPKFISGPIERAEEFLPQIEKNSSIPDYQTCRQAAWWMLWGYFEKLVIADIAALLVNTIFEKYAEQSGLILIFGAVLFGIQLYADFDGYSHMAMGMAKFFGFQITNNFSRPYFARSIAEFWHRWHISLSTWLRDYIYIPLGGNRKGKFRQFINLLITFGASGIWHGTGSKYLVWGMLHGSYQILGKLLQPWKEKLKKFSHINENGIIFGIFQRLIVFLLVDFAWIFFRAGSLRAAFQYLQHIILHLISSSDINTSLLGLGIQPVMLITLMTGIMLLFVVEIIQEMKISIAVLLDKRTVFFRWIVYAGILFLIACAVLQRYGMDASGFLYADF